MRFHCQLRSLLVLGVVAAAIARPAADSGVPPTNKCAATCKGRELWKGYEVGKTFVHKFNHTVLTSNLKVDGNSAWLSASGTADIEVISNCEMVLRVKINKKQSTCFKDWKPGNKKSPRQVFEKMETIPVRFSYYDGQIKDVCWSNKEERASLNLKRAILSNFQLNVPTADSARLSTEKDILGECWTEYEIRGPKRLRKTKDLRTCKNRDKFYSPIQGQRYTSESGPNSLPLLKSSFECQMRFKTEAGKDILSSNECLETHIFRPFSRGDKGAKVEVRTKLTYVKTKSSVKPLPDKRIQNRGNLYYDHRPSKHCHNKAVWGSEIAGSVECLERGEKKMATDTYKNLALTTLKKLCTLTSDDVKPQVAAQFSLLVKHLRGIENLDDLAAMDTYVEGESCADNMMIAQIFHDALPMLGTEASVKFMIKLMKDNHAKKSDRSRWLSSIAFTRHPTRKMVAYMKPLMMDNRGEDYVQVVLTVSSLIYRLCQTDSKCMKDSGVSHMVSSIAHPLGHDCTIHHGDTFARRKMLVSLRALGNMGKMNDGIYETLSRCMMHPTMNDMEIKVSAVQALRRAQCKDTNFPFTQLMTVVKNHKLDPELRINAYLSVMKCAAIKEDFIRQLAEMLRGEKYLQVGSFIYTHLSNLAESNDQFKKDVRFLLKDTEISKKFILDPRRYSRNIDKSYFSDAFNSGAKFDSNIIFSHQSYIPRSMNLNLTLDVFGRSMNFLEVGARVEGVEDLLESYWRSQEDKPQTGGHFASDAQKSSFVQRKGKTRASFYYRIFGNEINYIELGKNMKFAKGLTIKKILAKLAKGKEIKKSRSNIFLESVVSLPTTSGFPLLLKVEGASSTFVNAKAKVDLRTIGSGSVDINGRLAPSGAVRIQATMAVDGFFSKSGLRLVITGHTSTAASGSLTLKNGGKELQMKMAPEGSNKQTIVSFKSDIHYFHHDANKKHIKEAVSPAANLKVSVNRCTSGVFKKVFGFGLCIDSLYYKPSENTAKFPLNGPGSAKIIWKKEDTHTGYTFTAKYSKAPKKFGFLFDINTPGSAVNRQFLINIKGEKTATENTVKATLKTPFRSAIITGSMGSSGETRKTKLELVIDETRRYALIGSVSIGTKQTEGMYNVYRKGNFELSLPDRTEKPKLSVKFDFKKTPTGGSVSYETNFSGLKINNEVRKYESSATAAYVRKPTGTQYSSQIKCLTNNHEYVMSISHKTKKKNGVTTNILDRLYSKLVFYKKSAAKKREMSIDMNSKVTRTGPGDYKIIIKQIVVNKKPGVEKPDRHPLDMMVNGKLQVRPNSEKQFSFVGKVEYTSPGTIHASIMQFSKAVFGWKKTPERAAGIAEVKLFWHGASATQQYDYKVKYERKGMRLLSFYAKGSNFHGREDEIKIYHKMNSIAERLQEGLNIKQEIRLLCKSAKFKFGLLHTIKKAPTGATYQYIQLININGKKDSVEKSAKFKGTYTQIPQATGSAIHKVNTNLKVNKKQFSSIEVKVRPILRTQGPKRSGELSIKGEVRGKKFSFSHKMSTTPKSYGLKTEIKVPISNIQRSLLFEANIVTVPKLNYDGKFIVQVTAQRKYGIEMKRTSVTDPNYKYAVDIEQKIYYGEKTQEMKQKSRINYSRKNLEFYFKQKQRGDFGKLNFEHKLKFSSQGHKMVKLENKLKVERLDIDYEDEYEIEMKKSGGENVIKMEVVNKLKNCHSVDGGWKVKIKSQDKLKISVEMKGKTDFKQHESLKNYKSFKCMSEMTLDSVASSLKYKSVAKVNKAQIYSVKGTHSWKDVNLKNLIEIESMFSPLTKGKIELNSLRPTWKPYKRNGRLYIKINSNGQNYGGIIESSLLLGKKYYDKIEFTVKITPKRLPFPGMTVSKVDFSIKHKIPRFAGGWPAEIKGKVTTKIGSNAASVLTYNTRHENSNEQILATFDLQGKNSLFFARERDYQFRGNFEFDKIARSKLGIELLGKLMGKRVQLKWGYQKKQGKYLGKVIVYADVISGKKVDFTIDSKSSYSPDYKTINTERVIKLNTQTVWTDKFALKITNRKKVDEVSIDITSKLSLIKSLKMKYGHEFTDTIKKVLVKYVRNGMNRFTVSLNWPSADNSQKIVKLIIKPTGGPTKLIPHISFDLKHTGSHQGNKDCATSASFEVLPFFTKVKSNTKLLVMETGSKTFMGVKKAVYGIDFTASSSYKNLKKIKASFVYAKQASGALIKTKFAYDPFMKGAKALKFEAKNIKASDGGKKVSLKSEVNIWSKKLGLTYAHNIESKSPLKLTGNIEMTSKNKKFMQFTVKMNLPNEITINGKAPWLPVHVKASPMKIHNWLFKHTSEGTGNFKTTFRIDSPADSSSKLEVKFQLPTFKKVDFSVDAKTPYKNFQRLTFKLKHRHTNPLEIWKNMNDKIDFAFRRQNTLYSGKWNFKLQVNLMKEFGKPKLDFVLDTGVDLPFTAAKKRSIKTEIHGTKNKAKLKCTVVRSTSKKYVYTWSHNVPNWREFTKNANIKSLLVMPGNKQSKFTLERTSSLILVETTSPIQYFKRGYFMLNTHEDKLEVAVDGYKYIKFDLQTDALKIWKNPKSFGTIETKLKLPTLKMITLEFTQSDINNYEWDYSRGSKVRSSGTLLVKWKGKSRGIELSGTTTFKKFKQFNFKINRKTDNDNFWKIPKKGKYALRVQHNNNMYADVKGSLDRSEQWKILKMKIDVAGKFVEGTFIHEHNTNEKTFVFSGEVRKIKNMPKRYAVTWKGSSKVHTTRFLKDYTLKVDIPTRIVLLREFCDWNAQQKIYKTEVDLYLNKRKSEGLSFRATRDTSDPKRRKVNIELKLPKRTIRHKVNYFQDNVGLTKWRKITADIKTEWKVGDNSKTFTGDIKLTRNPGKEFNALVNLKSPLMKKPVKITIVGKKETANKKTLTVKYVVQPGKDFFKFKLTREKPTNGLKDKINTIEMVTQQNNKKMVNIKLVVDYKRLAKKQVNFSYKFKAKAPASEFTNQQAIDLDLSANGMYQPWRRFLVSSNSGNSLDFNYKPQAFGSKFYLTVSNSKKQAAQLSYSRDVRKPEIKIQLNRGKGYMESTMPYTFQYTPSEARAKVNIGLVNRNSARIMILVGKQSLGRTPSGWVAQTHDLAFFFAGIKLTPKNILQYAVKYRFSDNPKNTLTSEMAAKTTNAFKNLRMYLVDKVVKDPYAKKIRSVSRAAVLSALSCHKNNLQPDAIKTQIKDFIDNDYNSFIRVAKRMINNNEFYCKIFFKTISQFRSRLDPVIQSFKTFATKVSQGLTIMKDFVYNKLTNLRSNMKSAAGSLWQYLQSVVSDPTFLNNLIKKIKAYRDWRNAVIARCVERMQRISDAIKRGRQRVREAFAQLRTKIKAACPSCVAGVKQISNMVKENCRAFREYLRNFRQKYIWKPLKNNPDYKNMIKNIKKIRDTINKLIVEVKKIKLYEFFPSQQRFFNYVKITRKAVKLLREGKVKQAYDTYFQTKLVKVKKFELTCPKSTNAQCKAAKWHASVEGQFYMRPYLPSLRFVATRVAMSATTRVQMLLKQLKKVRSRGRKAYKYINTRLLDLMTRMRRIRKTQRAIPPFKGVAWIAGGQRFITFDRRHFDHAGDCSYLLTHDFKGHGFSVKAQYVKKPARKGFTYKWNKLFVKIDNKEVVLGSDGKVTVDSATKNLPLMVPNSKIMIMRMGDTIKMKRPNGLTVKCYLKFEFCKIKVSRWYYNRVGGLLGTYDNEPYNDLTSPMRKVHEGSELAKFARAWAVGSCVNGINNAKVSQKSRWTCNQLFRNVATFGRCFPYVDPKPFLQHCENELTESNSRCKTAALYVAHCRQRGIIIQSPRDCISCDNSGTKRYKGKGKAPTDYIFVIEAAKCAKTNLAALKLLPVFLNAYTNGARYGLVLYGGTGVHSMPHQHTVGYTKFLGNKAEFLQSLAEASKLFKGSSRTSQEMGMRAVRYVTDGTYPATPLRGRVLVLVACSSSLYGMNDYARTQRHISRTDHRLHVITNADFKVQRRDPSLTVYGVGQNTVYTSKDVAKIGVKNKVLGNRGLSGIVQAPKDLPCTLAVKNSGVVWNAKNLSGTKQQRRSMVKVIAKLMSISGRPPKCVRCRCKMQPDNMSGATFCTLCNTRRYSGLGDIFQGVP